LVFVVYDVATVYFVFVFVGVGAVTVTTVAVTLPLRTVTGAGVTVEVTKVVVIYVTVVAAAVLVDVTVTQSEVTVSVTTSGCGSGARLSRLMSRLLAFSRRSLLSLRYFDISKGAALSATRRNLGLAMLVGRVTEIATVGLIVQVGSG
jgi:hypothetical protein